MHFPADDSVVAQHKKVFILAKGSRVLSSATGQGELFSLDVLTRLAIDDQNAYYIGEYHTQHCYVLQMSSRQAEEAERSEGLSLIPIRALLGIISTERFQMLGRALQVTAWARDHRYCGVCGKPTQAVPNERALMCAACDRHYYPRIAPCILCLVTHGDRCLLARHAKSAQGFFTTLAGFVEPGETAEQAVHREIYEEVGLKVKKLRYIESQAWPFPGQLMLGFTAEYAEGQIQADGEEVLEAAWFDGTDLPPLPPDSTIAGQLIRNFFRLKGIVIA